MIKEHSLSGDRLKSHTLTGAEINLSKLGKVPSAATADSATNATNATNATTAGSAAISKVTYVTAPGTVPASSDEAIYQLTANCPAGTTVIGGGRSVADEGATQINDSYPDGKTGWTADYYSLLDAPEGVTTTAICAPAASTAP